MHVLTRQEAIATVRAEPHSATAWINLGNLLVVSGESVRARECFERALKLDPHNTAAHCALAALDTPSSLPGWLQGAPQQPPIARRSDPLSDLPADHVTRAWSPMTHILLAHQRLSLEEIRAMNDRTSAPPEASSWPLWVILGTPLALLGGLTFVLFLVLGT